MAPAVVQSHLPDGGTYRYRRHTRYLFDRPTGAMTVTANEGYFQTSENNPFVGGMVRKYEELEPEARDNAFLHAVVAFNVDQLPSETDRWAVQVHCVRVVARAGSRGRVTPEGMHRDGCTFISVHMLDRHNIAGGESTVWTPDGQRLVSKVFARRLDSFIAEDARVRHGVGDITVADPALGDGLRDMILMSYDPA